MEGTPDMVNVEVRCPNCGEWTYPQLPKAETAPRPAQRPAAARPELMGQARLDALVGANEDTTASHKRRHRRAVRPPRKTEELWFVLTDSGPKGPYANEQIVNFARQGKINKANRLRNAKTGVDYRAGDIPNLFPSPEKPAGKPEPAEEPQWFVQTAKGHAGPFTDTQIVAFAKDGKINAKTMLRKGHTGQFVSAAEIRGLLPADR